jgi:hypothetical protein
MRFALRKLRPTTMPSIRIRPAGISCGPDNRTAGWARPQSVATRAHAVDG